MLSKLNIIEQGELKLQSFAKPPMVAGRYKVVSNLGLKNEGGAALPGTINGESLEFVVDAPQFGIDEGLIHSIYPEDGAISSYSDSLPHIVLKRKTLPWERSVNSNPDDPRPWLYLLMLTADEMPAVTVKKIRTSDLLADAALELPKISSKDVEGKGAEIKVLDLPVQLFAGIAPTSNELRLLSHTRQADTTGKETNEDNAYGWYSVLVGNRLPPPEKDGKGVEAQVFLVSLEGYGDLIDSGYKTGKRTMRLVVLKQWAFTSEGATFNQLITALSSNGRLLQREVSPSLISAGVLKAFRFGYTPLNHIRRDGQQAPSWYRGPLVPVKISKPPSYVFSNADEALRFDMGTGMFDASYSVAWQLGRLLALQDPAYASSITNWNNNYKRERPVVIAREILQEELGIEADKLPELIATIEEDEVLADFVLELWGNGEADK